MDNTQKLHLMVRENGLPFDTIDGSYILPNIAYVMGGEEEDHEIQQYALIDDNGQEVSIETVALNNDTADLGLIEYVITQAIDEHFIEIVSKRFLDQCGF